MRDRSTDELIRSFRHVEPAYSKGTLRIRRARMGEFRTWLDVNDLPWPCHPIAIIKFLMVRIDARPGTLAGYVDAIRWHFIEEEHCGANPARHPLVRDFLAGHVRKEGRRPPTENQSRRLHLHEIEALCATAAESGTTADLQTRAHILVLMGWALRHSHTTRMRLDDLRRRDDGVETFVRGSKTDQQGKGRALFYPHTCRTSAARTATCAACAIVDHVEALTCQPWIINDSPPGIGPLFRRPDGKTLDGNAARKSLKKLAERAGVEPLRLGTHSFKRTHISLRSEKGQSSTLQIAASTDTSVKVLGSHYIDVNSAFPQGAQ